MRALTLHRPWDFAIAHGGKDVENRPWKPWASVIGHRIALHAGKVYDYEGAEFIKRVLGKAAPRVQRTEAGLIAATTRIAGCVARDVLERCACATCAGAYASPWFFGPYGWVLRDTIALPEPVPCKGALGLWKLPPAVEAEVLRQEQLARSKSA